jgi:hypothetical protein
MVTAIESYGIHHNHQPENLISVLPVMSGRSIASTRGLSAATFHAIMGGKHK